MNWLATLLIALLVSSCGGSANKKEVKIAYVNWEESIAFSNVAKVALESEGYKVTLMNADVAPVFASLSRKKADVFMNVWLPQMHKHYMEKYGSKLEKLSRNYDNGRIGLVVPQYMKIDSITCLNKIGKELNFEIVGIDPGAGAMKAAQHAIEYYKLKDFKLLTSSEPAMLATLKKAYDAQKPIVITGWNPHWMFDRFDLKFLEDPKKILGDIESIETWSWKGYSEQDPYAARFFSNISFTDATIASLLNEFKKHDNQEEAAKAWIKSHEDVVKSWLPEHK